MANPQGPSHGLTFDPVRPIDLAPFVVVALGILVISFLARVIQPPTPHVGVYEVKPARVPKQAPGRAPKVATQVVMAANARQKREPHRLGNMAARYARIVFGLLS